MYCDVYAISVQHIHRIPLPLHHSQREIACTEHYADFSLDIRPTADFLGQLLSHGNGIEVLEPLELREKMRQMIAENLKRY